MSQLYIRAPPLRDRRPAARPPHNLHTGIVASTCKESKLRISAASSLHGGVHADFVASTVIHVHTIQTTGEALSSEHIMRVGATWDSEAYYAVVAVVLCKKVELVHLVLVHVTSQVALLLQPAAAAACISSAIAYYYCLLLRQLLHCYYLLLQLLLPHYYLVKL